MTCPRTLSSGSELEVWYPCSWLCAFKDTLIYTCLNAINLPFNSHSSSIHMWCVCVYMCVHFPNIIPPKKFSSLPLNLHRLKCWLSFHNPVQHLFQEAFRDLLHNSCSQKLYNILLGAFLTRVFVSSHTSAYVYVRDVYLLVWVCAYTCGLQVCSLNDTRHLSPSPSLNPKRIDSARLAGWKSSGIYLFPCFKLWTTGPRHPT